jgi:superfamily II DNA or RNA helicase
VRFVVAHSDVDKIIMDQSLAKFNSPDNAHGMNFMILIGSKIIKESYDFKDIQNLIIMSLPINIPTLIQVFGRCIRKNSHINLPPE